MKVKYSLIIEILILRYFTKIMEHMTHDKCDAWWQDKNLNVSKDKLLISSSIVKCRILVTLYELCIVSLESLLLRIIRII